MVGEGGVITIPPGLWLEQKLDNVPNYFNCGTIQILTVQIQHYSVCNTYSVNTTSTNLMY